VILRVGWVYSPFGKNFFLNMLRRAREGTALRIVNDQIGVPTSADSIAAVTAQVLHAPDLAGLFHYAPSGQCSWFEFTQLIMRTAGVRASVDPITTAEYPTPARRPAYSVLDSEKLRAALPIANESWEEQLERNVARVHASVQA
jgi:dTDP-4-dehydrorhamnose reductase